MRLICLVFALFIILLAGCGQSKPELEVSALVTIPVHMPGPMRKTSRNIFEDQCLNVRLTVKNVGTGNMTFDKLAAGVLDKQSRGVTITSTSLTKDGKEKTSTTINAGTEMIADIEIAPTGQAWDFFSNPDSGTLYLVCYCIEDGEAITPVFVGVLPKYDDLQPVDHINPDEGVAVKMGPSPNRTMILLSFPPNVF